MVAVSVHNEQRAEGSLKTRNKEEIVHGDRVIVIWLVVIAAMTADYLSGGWLIQQNLSALWSLILGQ